MPHAVENPRNSTELFSQQEKPQLLRCKRQFQNKARNQTGKHQRTLQRQPTPKPSKAQEGTHKSKKSTLSFCVCGKPNKRPGSSGACPSSEPSDSPTRELSRKDTGEGCLHGKGMKGACVTNQACLALRLALCYKR
jgi:hypothetical protein